MMAGDSMVGYWRLKSTIGCSYLTRMVLMLSVDDMTTEPKFAEKRQEVAGLAKLCLNVIV